jgi:hypothetical protein
VADRRNRARLVRAGLGRARAAVDWVTYAAIFALFFLHGARLPREALVAGFGDVKLHATILLVTFGLFPLFGLALYFAAPNLFDPMIWTGAAVPVRGAVDRAELDRLHVHGGRKCRGRGGGGGLLQHGGRVPDAAFWPA